MSDWTPTSDKKTLLEAAKARGLNLDELPSTNLEIVDVLAAVDEYTAEQNAEVADIMAGADPDFGPETEANEPEVEGDGSGEALPAIDPEGADEHTDGIDEPEHDPTEHAPPIEDHGPPELLNGLVEQALAGAEAVDPEDEDDFTEGWDEADDEWEDGAVLRFVLTMGSKTETGVVAAEFRDELEAKASSLKGAKIQFFPAAEEGDKVCITSIGSRSGVVTQVAGHRCRVKLDGKAKIGGSLVSSVSIDRGECAVVP